MCTIYGSFDYLRTGTIYSKWGPATGFQGLIDFAGYWIIALIWSSYSLKETLAYFRKKKEKDPVRPKD
jgi:hypothetical protein